MIYWLLDLFDPDGYSTKYGRRMKVHSHNTNCKLSLIDVLLEMKVSKPIAFQPKLAQFEVLNRQTTMFNKETLEHSQVIVLNNLLYNRCNRTRIPPLKSLVFIVMNIKQQSISPLLCSYLLCVHFCLTAWLSLSS